MSDNLTTQETKITLSVQQLESLIRKMVFQHTSKPTV